MKIFYTLLTIVLLSCHTVSARPPRLLVTTDIGGDPDDQQSLVRLLLYSCEFDIEGIIASASGSLGELSVDTTRTDLIYKTIEAYSSVYKNLLQHNINYPAPHLLKRVVKQGSKHRGADQIGTKTISEGAQWIIQRGDQKDKRPLNIAVWGGQTDLAQALMYVKKSRSRQQYLKFINQIVVFDINDQDRIFQEIRKEHPTLKYILSKALPGHDKREGAYRGIYLGGDESLTSRLWLSENVTQNHGTLGMLYPTQTWTEPNPHKAMKEGDTPSWFFFLDNGLNNSSHPEWGGWGGRYTENGTNLFRDACDTLGGELNGRSSVYRWREAFQNDFAARLDWCTNPVEAANHHPVISLKRGQDGKPICMKRKPGSTIKLNAVRSFDPDQNKLIFDWFVYNEAGNLSEKIELKINGPQVEFVVPPLNHNSAIHLILALRDDGKPALTSYQRVIITN